MHSCIGGASTSFSKGQNDPVCAPKRVYKHHAWCILKQQHTMCPSCGPDLVATSNWAAMCPELHDSAHSRAKSTTQAQYRSGQNEHRRTQQAPMCNHAPIGRLYHVQACSDTLSGIIGRQAVWFGLAAAQPWWAHFGHQKEVSRGAVHCSS